MKTYKKCTAEKFSFLLNNTSSDNFLQFRKNLWNEYITNHDN